MDLPSRAGLVTAWLNAPTGADDIGRLSALAAIVDGVSLDGTVLPLAACLDRWATATARLILPIPGDTGGLPDTARDCVEAVHIATDDDGVVLLPPGMGERWWTALPAAMDHLSPGGSTRADFRRVIRNSAEDLEHLDLAMHDPTVRVRLRTLDTALRDLPLPRHLAGRPTEVIEQASRVLLIVQIAEETDGASVTGTESGRRRQILAEAGRGARAALMDAYSAADTVGP